jgi:hypothetical protein
LARLDTQCPSCGHHFDDASAMRKAERDSEPYPGDVTVCIECTDVLILTDTLDVRWPTPEEWKRFPPFTLEQIRVIQRAIRHLHRRPEP